MHRSQSFRGVFLVGVAFTLLCVGASGCKYLERWLADENEDPVVTGDSEGSGKTGSSDGNTNPPVIEGADTNTPSHSLGADSLAISVEPELRSFWSTVRTPGGSFQQAPLGGPGGRIRDRLASIDQYKAQGILGETDAGLLAFPPGQADLAASTLMIAENADRQAVYLFLSQQGGVSTSHAGKESAGYLIPRLADGAWKREGGKWSQHKAPTQLSDD